MFKNIILKEYDKISFYERSRYKLKDQITKQKSLSQAQ